ncbi:flagellar hook-basal body complex protein FliE [Phaeovulum vinaykumarii]|uniref:Flagellar hook-basal body complex protein FliE n=1 Tax=Phaeovulum vinaykumarii TaxID=407234 RepID=A0A1N7KVS1_9RHOB|nr:flagellar hook-basal body complex protein FliE [Phaeovulum vinaykumarii]SIS65510.1 flagellar hook-basal body complex protein FliE [Phaeovulum vinaykumarii]SOC01256.1 flagellar hook-basal body complex protein FliE [Phaeovulum vinaykumarii]
MDFTTNIAAKAYAQARPATEAQTGLSSGSGQNLAGQAFDSFAQALQHGEQTAKAAMTGGADPHSLVTALAQTELAVETAVTVRDKVVEAYQEILRMPV